MRTDKIVRIFISLFLCIGCFSAYAQKDANQIDAARRDFLLDKWDSVFRENLKIEDEINTLRLDTILLGKKISDIDEKYKTLSDSISYYEKECRELEDSIDKKSFEAILAEIESLQKTVNELNYRKTELKELCSRLADEIDYYNH